MSLYGRPKFLFHLYRDAPTQRRYRDERAALLAEYTLSDEERAAIVRGDIGLTYVLGANGQLLMHFAAFLGMPWPDYLQAMRDGVVRQGPVRAGVYAMTTSTDNEVAGLGLSYSNFHAAQLFGKVAYHAFEGITVRAEEGARIVASAAGKPVLLLRNHGPVTIDHSIAQAFGLMWLLNRACEVPVATLAMGQPRPIEPAVLEGCVRDSLQFDPRFGAGQDAFDALQRVVDRIDPTYRDRTTAIWRLKLNDRI